MIRRSIIRNPLSLLRWVAGPAYERLSDEELQATLYFAKQGQAWARQRVVLGVANIIVAASRRDLLWAERVGLELEDLIGAAVLDTYAAFDDHDPSQSCFRAYLKARLSYSVRTYIKQNCSSIRICAGSEYSERSLLAAKNAAQIASLDELREENPGFDVPALEAPEPPPDELSQPVAAALETLSPQVRGDFLEHYGVFGPSETYREAAGRRGVTRSTVKENTKLARKRLRAALGDVSPLRARAA